MTLLKDNNYKDINIALLSLETDIKNKMAGLDTSVIDRQLVEINNRIDKINAGSSSALINDIRTEIEDINSQLDANSTKIEGIEQNIEGINTQIEGIEQKLSDIFSAENLVTDFNSTTDAGIYYWVDTSTNKPGTDYGVLLVNKAAVDDSNIWINQIAYGTNGSIYFRQKINSANWTEWKAVAFEGKINADTVDNYHASDLWRSDGATWNPGANVVLNAVENGNEWSFDIRRNDHTGCYWHVRDSALGSLLRVNADDGKVSAPKGFVGNLSGTTEKALKDANGEVITETYARLDKVGAASGIASLGPSGTLPLEQLPTEAIVFKGMWNASTNTPRLANGTGTSGDYYIVSVGGTVNFGSDNITFVAGDGVIYDGSKWHRKADTNLVQSVNGQTGNVTIRDIAGNAATATTAATATKATQDGNGNNIVNTYATKSMLNNRVNGALCSTGVGVAAKVVSIDNFVLKAGAVVSVMFVNGNSVGNTTLNVSGTGAKYIKVVKAGVKVAPASKYGKWRGGGADYEMWQPYTVLDFIYDGTDWVIMGNPVVESYYSTTQSYEVKADGLISIFGYQDSYSNVDATVNLPITFTSANYFISLQYQNRNNVKERWGSPLAVYNVTNSSFVITTDSNVSTTRYKYHCLGY